MMCSAGAVALLLGCVSALSASKLLEHTAQSFRESQLSGKTAFIYFGKHVNPAIKAFIEQLEMSAQALEDYGLTVGKRCENIPDDWYKADCDKLLLQVNCSKESVEKYCVGEEVMRRAYLFRGAEVLRSFDIDTVFDVNAIVSHVLFTVLFREVRYVHTPAELLAVERAAKGKMDIVMGHVQVLGLPGKPPGRLWK
ncbi:hypothetical protein NFI96_004721 [Prochilodus magdalenae]|nr:hypothetical protein NFI96_004721 [Prochilodus magdalenae]